MSLSSPDIVTLAGASGSSGGLGLIGTVANNGVLYVRLPCGRDVEKVEWMIKCDQQYDTQLYVADSIVESATFTFSSMGAAATNVINGVTYTAHASATVGAAATRTFSIAGNDTADAAAFVSIVNEGGVVTCASASVGDTVTVDGITMTAAATEALPFTFSQAGTDTQDATSLAACINNAANPLSEKYLASTTAGEVRIQMKDPNERYNAVVGSSNGTRLAVTTCGQPGIVATSAAAVATIKPKTRGNGAYVLQVANSAGATAAWAGLTSLVRSGAAAVGSSNGDSTTGGVLLAQTTNGWPYAYLGITNKSGSAAATMVIKAARYRYHPV